MMIILIYYGTHQNLRDKNDNFFAFVDFNADDVGKIRECPHCLEFEIHNKLKPRQLKKGEKSHQIMINLSNVMNAVTYSLSMKHTLNQK